MKKTKRTKRARWSRKKSWSKKEKYLTGRRTQDLTRFRSKNQFWWFRYALRFVEKAYTYETYSTIREMDEE